MTNRNGLFVFTGMTDNDHISFRGPASINSSNAPLVVVNGSAIGTLDEANRMVNIYDIATIEVKKNASEWGVRGANGVILIKTR